jgi:hypothetical protein
MQGPPRGGVALMVVINSPFSFIKTLHPSLCRGSPLAGHCGTTEVRTICGPPYSIKISIKNRSVAAPHCFIQSAIITALPVGSPKVQSSWQQAFTARPNHDDSIPYSSASIFPTHHSTAGEPSASLYVRLSEPRGGADAIITIQCETPLAGHGCPFLTFLFSARPSQCYQQQRYLVPFSSSSS